ncbi:sugar ABC transporter permease [Virgibacillus profundi]|uniref:Sugar ABC transporter permease n=1 Tax=Virgibacillus profundi TaxID=2024555 RepID=A0A2A2IHN8_9BACI|nr:sugar ABC transporter permease [Virgibacillus profundi]PAV30764.1 sugar ABC transporter permease [Virgibacillus profundi]PXY54947.1 sugar ABC transporter permease [Virgibacillus profundi]
MKAGYNNQKKPLKLNDKKSEIIWGYILIAPAFAILLIFHILPALSSFWFALTEWNGMTAPSFIGLENYINMFKDEQFMQSVVNTTIFTAGSVSLSVIVAVFFAVQLNKKIRARAFYRSVYFLPFVIMLVAVGTTFSWVFNSQFGLVNQILGFFGLPTPSWITNPELLMTTMILADVWHKLGYNLVILLAGLQSIPRTFYEAADIDGANSFQKFWTVTLPLLSPSLFFVIIISLINSFKMFDLVFIMTGGNPILLEGTSTMVYNIYEQAFTYSYMGYASAQSILLFFIIMIATLIQFYLQKKWVHY